MTSRISYFVIYSPNYIEAARCGNFYLGSISALLQQLRHYCACSFKTGDTKNIFGAVTLWPHVHTCWCRTKLWSAGAHILCSTLTTLLRTSKNFYPAGLCCSLSFSLAIWVYDQNKWWKGWKSLYLQHKGLHFFLEPFSPTWQKIFCEDEKRNEHDNHQTLVNQKCLPCATQAIFLQVQACFYCKAAGEVNEQMLQILGWRC